MKTIIVIRFENRAVRLCEAINATEGIDTFSEYITLTGSIRQKYKGPLLRRDSGERGQEEKGGFMMEAVFLCILTFMRLRSVGAA